MSVQEPIAVDNEDISEISELFAAVESVPPENISNPKQTTAWKTRREAHERSAILRATLNLRGMCCDALCAP